MFGIMEGQTEEDGQEKDGWTIWKNGVTMIYTHTLLAKWYQTGCSSTR